MSSKQKNFIVLPKKNFICGNCGAKVCGGRYINHCPVCLWSKHLDKDLPGDRQSTCGSLMEPIGVIKKGDKWRICHQCVRCNKKTIVDAKNEDNFEKIIKLVGQPTKID